MAGLVACSEDRAPSRTTRESRSSTAETVERTDPDSIILESLLASIGAGSVRSASTTVITEDEATSTISANCSVDFESRHAIGEFSTSVATSELVPGGAPVFGQSQRIVNGVRYVDVEAVVQSFLNAEIPGDPNFWDRVKDIKWVKTAKLEGGLSIGVTFSFDDCHPSFLFLLGASQVTRVGKETIDGSVNTRYSATLTHAALKALLAEKSEAIPEFLLKALADDPNLLSDLFPGGTLLDVWIDNSGRLSKFEIEMGTPNGGDLLKSSVISKTSFSDYGAEIRVSVPLKFIEESEYYALFEGRSD